jgi:hypothetical protein
MYDYKQNSDPARSAQYRRHRSPIHLLSRDELCLAELRAEFGNIEEWWLFLLELHGKKVAGQT